MIEDSGRAATDSLVDAGALKSEILELREQLKSIADQLEGQSRMLRVAIEASDDIIIEVDARTGALTLDSEKLFRLYGVPSACKDLNYLMEMAYQRLHPDDKRRFLDEYQVNADGTFPIKLKRKTGEFRFFVEENMCYCLQITSTPISSTTEGVSRLFVHIKNITQQKAQADLFKDISNQDSLTGAYNLKAIRDKVTQHLVLRGKSGVLIVFGIDKFELISETMDPEYESGAMSMLVRILKSKVRREDFVAKTRNDEYLMFITGPRSRKALSKDVEEIMKTYSEYLKSREMPKGVSVTAGISMAPTDGEDFDALYEKADKALRSVAPQGRIRYAFV